MTGVWTILIPTLGQRSEMLARLLDVLIPQVERYDGAVKVLAYYNNGSPPLAHVRQALVEAVQTEYMSFVDDDDMVPDYFVAETMWALGTRPDYVGWQTRYFADGEDRGVVDQSLRHGRWWEDRRTGALYRDITHTNPMRTAIARQADFRRVRPGRAEDRAWVAQLRGKLTTEVYLDKVMYHYLWRKDTSAWQHPERIQPGPRLDVDHPHFAYYDDGGNVSLTSGVDLRASLHSLAVNAHVCNGMLKLPHDLDRYRRIIDATRPQVIVETGTHGGASAMWFAAQLGVQAVVTVDIRAAWLCLPELVYPVLGDSAEPAVVARVRELVAGRRCMVSLDSDHSAAHVSREIELYGPLVSPGCYLVVEDGIFGHAPPALRRAHLPGLVGSPLEAIAEKLVGADGWTRDHEIENAFPLTHHVAGWWRRDG